jgi:N-acetylmuramic acid 6-phosphate etherase
MSDACSGLGMLDSPVSLPHPPDRKDLLTEQRNDRSMSLHTMSVAELVQLHHSEDTYVLKAMVAAQTALTRLIEAAEPGFVAGGRLIYIGAGTSGRLGVLDASEAPPTFMVSPDRVVGLIAGGDTSLRQSSEGREDDPAGAASELDTLNLTPQDTFLGIAAGGTTPYVLGALELVKQRCAQVVTGMITCTPIERPAGADHLVVLETGPELITGSTRMKAGTATKLALNTISTSLMVRSGRVYQNLMVDMKATNDKLRDRAARVISELTKLDREQAFDLLDQADGHVKVAVVMHHKNIDRAGAEQLLRDAQGRLDAVIR